MTASIRLQRSAPIAELILHKPEKRNALSIDMWAEIPSLMQQVREDASIKVLIIHGGETGAFAAGADISEFAKIYATEESAAQSGRTIAGALKDIEDCPKPVIAAINGPCFGAGVSIAMCADMRTASEDAKFCVPPGKLGLVYPAADTRRLIEAIGPARTKDLLFTAQTISAREALEMCLVDRCVPEGASLKHARELAENISALSQWSVRASKRMIKGLQSGWSETGEEATALFTEGFRNADFADGHKAFLEKRAPKFTL